MKFSILERSQTINLLPRGGGKTETLVLKGLLEKLEITLDEIKLIELVEANGRSTWNASKDPMKDIELNAAEINMLNTVAKKADEEKTYTLEYMNTLLKLEGLSAEVKDE